MGARSILFGTTQLDCRSRVTIGAYTEVFGEVFFELSDYDQMQPFLFTLASDSDHWMYISSRGGLTCGRKNPDHALFPYYTDDKIHDAAGDTGPYTALLVQRRGQTFFWRPFCDSSPRIYSIERRLLKSPLGNRVVFEERNNSLGLRYAYSWELSGRFGFVRSSFLDNEGEECRVDVLDGLRNILPAGVDRVSQERSSTLLDGYKQVELDPSSGMGIYTLGSIVTDRTEPSEALRATTVFQAGLPDVNILLSGQQISRFEVGEGLRSETAMRGRRGAYLVGSSFSLDQGEQKEWMFIADVEQDVSAVVRNKRLLFSEADPAAKVREDVQRGTVELKKLVGSADGFQLTADRRITDRHYSNVLFNIMRGGVFVSGYRIDTVDFSRFVSLWNRKVASAHSNFLRRLPAEIKLQELQQKVEGTGDADLVRLTLEYLPITFSRRHGDPSRPWNKFVIDVRTPEGKPKIAYQGNWRDIFQNWEALAMSYPRYLNGMIAKFVDATTADGYNPYRISQAGIDWEVFDPDDPWSNIGYWGDHQIAYLSRLLELSFRYDPEEVRKYLTKKIFTFADIPYRIRSFSEILQNPHSTIIYDAEKEKTILERVEKTGADGKLLATGEGLLKASLLEKLLITLLTKLSNLVPGGGVWMNTQRPEWNDANNALAGYGMSVVTTAYLHRFVLFLQELIPSGVQKITVTKGVAVFLREIFEILSAYQPDKPDSQGVGRMDFVRAAGKAGERYREKVYDGTFAVSDENLTCDEIMAFLRRAEIIAAATLRENKRSDYLYHSYNIMELRKEGILVDTLDEMLEGQVAMLSSGLLAADETMDLLKALRRSSLYRADQRSYILYPDRQLPSFLEKNILPEDLVAASPLVKKEAARKDGRIIVRDGEGQCHFHSDLRNARILNEHLDELDFSPEDRSELCAVYEEVFQHRRFTGRSGTFFKYEGLGSIYWHMVSKLELAVVENALGLCGRSGNNREETGPSGECVEHLKEIKEGIGAHKTPPKYGAFPIDPYSHTPGFAGVQQPGMTGQVKEDIIARFLELGVTVREGRVGFQPALLDRSEFLEEEGEFFYFDTEGKPKHAKVAAGSMAFSFCNVPVFYHRGDREAGRLVYEGNVRSFSPSEGLSEDLSGDLFDRSGKVERVDVTISLI
ncbi:MAG: hypothetical protein K9L66_10295 [Spirochaetaceae bacterium]|nr:hypothetical protein [Spirochaetaceae bacterium]MCF7947604.1 hypothetical protein [Spirochaetia bacterium]MCF7951916.1 hypothetical protein [Spirochaetaceae bacterium]